MLIHIPCVYAMIIYKDADYTTLTVKNDWTKVRLLENGHEEINRLRGGLLYHKE